MDRVADFLFEVGILKRTPRSGWAFLGSGAESVADHTFRAAVIALVLARLDSDADVDRAVRLALLHDLPEARTGDLNYVHQRYVVADEERAAADQRDGLPIADELAEASAEYAAGRTREAVLAHDADQLEMLLSLKERRDAGASAADDWIPFVLERLRTDVARDLARTILDRRSDAWWFDRDSDWWSGRRRR